jgi:hypothetical protein
MSTRKYITEDDVRRVLTAYHSFPRDTHEQLGIRSGVSAASVGRILRAAYGGPKSDISDRLIKIVKRYIRSSNPDDRRSSGQQQDTHRPTGTLDGLIAAAEALKSINLDDLFEKLDQLESRMIGLDDLAKDVENRLSVLK